MTEESSSMRDIRYLRTIIRYCEDIEDFTRLHGSEEEDFKDDLSLQYSCAFSLIRIGEYVKRLSYELKEEYPQVDWKGAAGMRDIVAHDYANINTSRFRFTVLNLIPPLMEECKSILNEIE